MKFWKNVFGLQIFFSFKMTYIDEKLSSEVINHTQCVFWAKLKICRWNFDKNQHLLIFRHFGQIWPFWGKKVVIRGLLRWPYNHGKQTNFKKIFKIWKKKFMEIISNTVNNALSSKMDSKNPFKKIEASGPEASIAY